MKLRDLIIGIVIIILLAGAVYFFRQRDNDLRVPDETPIPSEREQELEDRFSLDLPEEAERVSLQSPEGEDVTGIATREFTDETFRVTILADLPDPNQEMFYQGWLLRGEEGQKDFAKLPLGRMRIAKGGYILEFEAARDYSNYGTVVISKEATPDNVIEEVVLEGSF